MTRRGWWVLGLVLALLLSACGGSEQPDAQPIPSSAPSPAMTPSRTPSAPPLATSASPSAPQEPPSGAPLPPVTHPVSLPALMRTRWQASRIRYQGVLAEAERYTRYAVTYRSGRVTVSGVLLRPRGKGPFPGIVLNHGYIDPAIYVTGQGLAREQEWLANAGFAVLHTDYRGHAGSDPAGELDQATRVGYARDAINAVLALEREPYVDPDRMAMLGRSMGGGVTFNALVAYPDLVEAAVVYASVSTDFLDNVRQFVLPNRPEQVAELYERFGSPKESPDFYAGLSARTYFDRISDPVLMHHGTEDESCPFRWATTTQRLLERADVDSRLEVYPGERHAFIPQWQLSIERTVRFLRRQLG